MSIMSMVSDFEVIQGDYDKRIGDTGTVCWQQTFEIKEFVPAGTALLMFMVKGLTRTDHSATVMINDRSIGEIFPYPGTNTDYWFTQIITFDTRCLRSGQNTLQISAAPHPTATAGNMYDDFDVRNVICFFRELA